MSQHTVLISGADGYIALHLTQYLRKNNYTVITSTRNDNGDLRMDFSNPFETASLRSNGIDTMIHTVSPNEALYKTDPYSALSENAAGIHAALNFCKNNEIKNFIYFSSFHVFGTQEGRLTENTLVSPQSVYGLAHCTAEQTACLFDRTNQVNSWIVRPSNLFGVPVDCDKFKRWNLIPFSFCREAIEHNRITLLTPGNQLRNFVGVSDVCKTVHWILEHRPEERIFHAYGRETINVYQFAQLVQKVAFEEYKIPVQIIRPEGSDYTADFEFTSLYDYPSLAPSADLHIYVQEMLEVLLDQYERSS